MNLWGGGRSRTEHYGWTGCLLQLVASKQECRFKKTGQQKKSYGGSVGLYNHQAESGVTCADRLVGRFRQRSLLSTGDG